MAQDDDDDDDETYSCPCRMFGLLLGARRPLDSGGVRGSGALCVICVAREPAS